METIIKAPVLEVDFINNIMVDNANTIVLPTGKKIFNYIQIIPEVKDRFLSEVIGSFWHSDNDKIERIVFYNTDDYSCQRKKLKYDFNTKESYWTTYEFKGASASQVLELKTKLFELTVALRAAKKLDVFKKVSELDKELLFYDQRYNKRLEERNVMLTTSDWRVLDDVEDSYPGEKDMWKAWRSALRSKTLKKPQEFDDTLSFMRHIYEVKWPVDPKMYFTIYPDGLNADGTPAPDFLDENDPKQWVERDVEASRNLVDQKLRNIMELRQRYNESGIQVKSTVKELMKKLSIHDFVEGGIDYTRVYTEEELNDLPST